VIYPGSISVGIATLVVANVLTCNTNSPISYVCCCHGAGVVAQVFGQRVVVGRPDWVLSQLPSGQSLAAAAAHLQQQLVPSEASDAKLTQVSWSVLPPLCLHAVRGFRKCSPGCCIMPCWQSYVLVST
jgi:hypothetical protein